MMSELTLQSGLEVHEHWLLEVRTRLKFTYRNIRWFSDCKDIDYLVVFWFLKGCPVEETNFRAICKILKLDWKAIQCELPVNH